MSDGTIAQVLRDPGVSQEITCTPASALGKNAGVAICELGEYCRKNRIKIQSCQQGCFK